MSSYHYLYQYFRIWYLGYVPFVSLFLCNFGMWPHSFYLLHTVYCFLQQELCLRLYVCHYSLSHGFLCVLSSPLICKLFYCLSVSYLLPTWCPVFKKTPCVYAFCSVIYFRGSYKTMDHSKVSPSCGNITHIWQSLWTMLYQIVILPVWYGIMFLLILYCFTVLFLCMNFCTVLQSFMYMCCRHMI